MTLTVDALAQEILRCSYSTGKGSFALAERILPFINRHIAAGQQCPAVDDGEHSWSDPAVHGKFECLFCGQQGADADLLLTVAVELEAQARAEERKTPSDGDGPSALREWARKLRCLASAPSRPKLHTSGAPSAPPTCRRALPAADRTED